MTDWQPIEAAPRDGTEILCLSRQDRALVVCWIGGWCQISLAGERWEIEEAWLSRWMPIPPQ